MGSPLKNQNLENIFLLAREDKKIVLKPNFHEPKSSHGRYLHGQPKEVDFDTGEPLKNDHFENIFFAYWVGFMVHCRRE